MILLATQVIDIGLLLDTLEVDPPLWTGVTITCDHSLSILPTAMNDENMSDKGATYRQQSSL